MSGWRFVAGTLAAAKARQRRDVLQLYDTARRQEIAACREFRTTNVKTIQQDAFV
jgi:uncharacterized protein YqeY